MTTQTLEPIAFYRCGTEDGELWRDVADGTYVIIVGNLWLDGSSDEQHAKKLLVSNVERLSYEMRLRTIEQAVERAQYYIHNGS